ncbi:energy-coupling factor transporter transmembrane component T family protein [Methanosarcina sp. Mfa9]|uniref:energy-coupling factor transporter transmembrane component T family protein n=1 Tax=Methanosarcina sp. Mfa9 TaxID=3439063 RepID=UPI003F857541
MPETAFNYVYGDSLLHRLDPRTKLAAVMCLSILVFREESFAGMGLLIAFFLLLTWISGVHLSFLLRSVRPLLFFIFVIFCFQLFATKGTPIIPLPVLSPTFEGLRLGTLLSLRFGLLLLYAALLTASTLPSQITNGIEHLLRPLPLRRLGVTSFDLATMMSLSIRFLPSFLENAATIRAAQLARGLDLKHDLRRGTTAIAVPLIRRSILSAEEVTEAMESRCYQGQCRTSLHELRMQKLDWIALLGLGAFSLFIFLL